jgi:hypothetical protein
MIQEFFENLWGLVVLVGLGYAAYSYFGSSSKYAAEVGYHAGTQIAWDVWGDFEDLDECRNAAINRYNFYFADNKRATSWSCLLKNSKGGYESRHR